MYYEKDTGYWGTEIQELEIPILFLQQTQCMTLNKQVIHCVPWFSFLKTAFQL